jgi:hypothetical protein
VSAVHVMMRLPRTNFFANCHPSEEFQKTRRVMTGETSRRRVPENEAEPS